MDFALLDAMLRAQDGDLRALADCVEKGMPLNDHARGFIASYLRGEVRFDRRKRSLADQEYDSGILMLVEHLARREKLKAQIAKEMGLKYRPRGGEALLLQMRQRLKPDTLKAILKRARADRRSRNRVTKPVNRTP